MPKSRSNFLQRDWNCIQRIVARTFSGLGLKEYGREPDTAWHRSEECAVGVGVELVYGRQLQEREKSQNGELEIRSSDQRKSVNFSQLIHTYTMHTYMHECPSKRSIAASTVDMLCIRWSREFPLQGPCRPK